MYKITKITALVLGVIAAILWVLLVGYYSGKNPFQVAAPKTMDLMFFLNYALTAIAIILAMYLPVISSFLSGEGKKAIIHFLTVTALIILVPIFLFVVSVDFQLYFFYLLIAVAIIVLIGTSVRETLTKK